MGRAFGCDVKEVPPADWEAPTKTLTAACFEQL